ncbi:NAD-dependent epimerase/dehydratase family protein [Paenibacillus tyrfis]|uniref:3-beta hydroxysteroid dehydrogenase n=1 Tax=Paenibacillus tyrfis TaxID=1501230 RepID=A0A081PAP1_9BACL|nr:SDR family NAD(P)-dependent oxidoreductase [Paenibacillus tyrfis]KEQ27764.1 3-beta hydroxysteroid dehydrogenase [Paenibacillus tyrfis]
MNRNALVTGGTGFLGRRLALRLRDEGWSVTAIGRQPAIGEELQRQGIRFMQADLRDRERMDAACAGQQAVFHCGALSASWGPYNDFYDSNVLGTEHVIAGCLKHQVGRLIHVSTPSVYFGSTHRLGVRESDPLPRRQASPYAATKRLAEEAVVRAGAAGLETVIVRPRAMFGPGDASILPRLIEANAVQGIPLIGGGKALIDLTYVDNAVDALLLCEAAPAATVAGRVYNITNGEPMAFGEAVSKLLGKLGVPVRFKRLPYAAAYGVAALMELSTRLIPGRGEPMLTRAVAGMIGRSQTLDISAARRELGYSPKIRVNEGMEAFAHWWRSKHDI